MTTRKKYSKEFKLDAVSLVTDQGYSRAEVSRSLEEHDSQWANWFAQQEIEPVRITYEALSFDPLAVLATVLSALGLDPAIAETVSPRTAKLANSESHEWAARFRNEKIKH